MLSALQIVALRAPQFSSSPRLPGMISYVQESISQSAFGESYENAVALKVMHLFTIEKMNGGTETNTGIIGSGQIVSETEGGLSRSYAVKGGVSSSEDDDLRRTGFGLEYLRLMKTTNISAFQKNVPAWLQK